MNAVPPGYRYLWAIVSGISVLVGAFLALVTLLVGAWVTVLIFGALAGCAALHLSRENRTRAAAAWDYGTAAASGAVIALAMAGLVSAFNGSGAALVAVLVVSAPPAVRWYRSRLHGLQPGAAQAAQVAERAAEAPAIGHDRAEHVRAKLMAMPARDLIDSWRLSGISLAKAQTASEISQQVLGRSMILDEIQSRYPAGFDAWVADGAPATSDLSGYAQPTAEARADDTD